MSLFHTIRERPFLADCLLAAVLVGFTIFIGVTQVPEARAYDVERPDTPIEWLLVCVPGGAIAFRRVRPVAAATTGVIATTIAWAYNFDDFTLASGILIYSVIVHGPEPAGRRTGFAAGAWLTFFTALGVTVGEAPMYVLPLVGLFSVTAAALGVMMSTRADYIAEVERRAELAERHQTISEEALLQGERNRIARELHDVVAHGLGVIVVQAGAGRRIIGRDPDGAAEALARIEEIGRSSLTEMRQMLGVMRTEHDTVRRPTPGLAAFDELLEDYRSSGLRVSFQEVGERPPLPSTVDTATYRIVQEALTNSLKHGGPDVEVFVEVAYIPEQVTLRVLDNGRGGSAQPGAGHGLRGMQERVDVFGGTLRTGPRPGGGFEVIASLPVRPVRTA